MHWEKQVFLIVAIGTCLSIFLSITLFIFYISYNKRKYKHIREKQKLHTDFQQEILKAQLEIQERTFENISQEIHDNIGQMLSLAKLNLNTVDFNDLPTAKNKVVCSKELVSKVISDLRHLSKSLNPEIINKIGLTEAVERELLMMAKAGQYEVNLSQEGDYYRLDGQKELIIFRIFQEMINNIINHSKARTVNVTVEYQPQYFSLKVVDDGQGFDISPQKDPDRGRGLGIQSMRNRARMIGADIQFVSAEGKGTTIEVTLSFSGEAVNYDTTLR